MEILKGLVKDPGYPDVECNYVKIDDNTIYYFVKDGELETGNYIVSSKLKEAIEHAPHTALGMIDKDGNVLIPLENKSIQRIKDNLLLVEKNVPTSPSVVAAIADKDDPNKVAQLSNNAEIIKKQISAIMGMGGDFIFDNPLSEATIYTKDGLNVSGSYYSFIGEFNSDYYFASNVVGEQLIKFNPIMLEQYNNQNQYDENVDNTTFDNSMEENVEESNSGALEQTVETTENDNTLDNVSTFDNSVENNVQESNTEAVNNETVEQASETTENTTTFDNPLENSIESSEREEVNNEDMNANIAESANLSNEIELPNLAGDINTSGVSEESSDTNLYEENTTNDNTVEDSSVEINEQEAVAEEEKDNEDDVYTAEEIENKESETNVNVGLAEEDISNPVIASATTVIKQLLNENKEQRQEIDRQTGELEAIKSNNEILSEENKVKTDELKQLRLEMNEYRMQNAQLLKDNNKMRRTIIRQAEVVKNLETQNNSLREQVMGLHALGNAVAEANILIDSDNNYSKGNVKVA